MDTISVANIFPLLKSLTIATHSLFLQQSLVEETFRQILENDFKQDIEHKRTLKVICSIGDMLRESKRENEKLLNALESL